MRSGHQEHASNDISAFVTRRYVSAAIRLEHLQHDKNCMMDPKSRSYPGRGARRTTRQVLSPMHSHVCLLQREVAWIICARADTEAKTSISARCNSYQDVSACCEVARVARLTKEHGICGDNADDLHVEVDIVLER